MQLLYIKERYLARLVRDRNTLKEAGSFLKSQPWLDDYFGKEQWNKESNLVVGDVPALLIPDRGDLKDVENSILIYEWLKKMTPAQASDARIWTYLNFVTFWEYNIVRWPVEKTTLDERYFLLRKNTRLLIRNSISRLWWFAYLTYDEARIDRYELTKVLLSNQDIQASLLERIFGKNRAVLHGALDFIRKNPDLVRQLGDDNKKAIQELAIRINRYGGATVLDTFSSEEIYDNLVKACG